MGRRRRRAPARPPPPRPGPRRGARRGARRTSPSRPATPSSWRPAAPRASPSWPCSPTTRWPRRRAPPASASASIPTSDRWLACLPLAHVGGLSVVTRALVTGTPCTVHERFDADAVEAAAARRLHADVARPDDARAASTPGCSGRSSSAARRRRPIARPTSIATYGMTETGSGVVYDGVPLAASSCGSTTTGRSTCAAPMLLRAYRDGTDPKDADGWFPTGDLGRLDDGRLEVHGRVGDLIITGGENVWPAAVERALAHPSRAWPRSRWSAAPTPSGASGWWRSSCPPTGRHLAVARRAARPRRRARSRPTPLPTDVELVRSLPRTGSGKVLRERPHHSMTSATSAVRSSRPGAVSLTHSPSVGRIHCTRSRAGATQPELAGQPAREPVEARAAAPRRSRATVPSAASNRRTVARSCLGVGQSARSSRRAA